MPKPLKRDQALQPLSREHHQGLLLCWKIREGLKHKINTARIGRYIDWFWENHLQAHFAFEEKYVFPILGAEHKLIKRALQEHKRLEQLFKADNRNGECLYLIEGELTSHIRFEERILFEEIQKIAKVDQLKNIEQCHSKNVACIWHDDFWIKE